MKIVINFIVLSLLVIVAGSCAHKRLAKKASEFEEQGMYEESSELYYQSVLKKNSYIDARTGLKRTGQRVIDDTFSKFTEAYNQGNNKEAVYYYLEAREFEDKISKVGIEFSVPPYYEEYYDEVKSNYLDDKYFEGKKHLNNEDFDKAEDVFREIVEIDENYKDASDKLNVTVYEPKYRQAVDYMGKGKYRSAYYLFDEILKGLGDYKEASDLKAEALDKATIRIGVEDFKNSSNRKDIDEQLKSKLVQMLNQSNNPFIKVVEYAGPQKYRSTRDRRNKSLQPDAIVKGNVLSCNYNMGRLKKESKPGYLKIVTKYKDSEGNTKTKTRYEKVTYHEYHMQRGVSINFNFKLVDTKNNEILISNNYNMSNKDNIHYAKYDGKEKDLVPGYWKHKNSKSDEDVIKDNRRHVRALQSLLSARKKIKTHEALSNELLNEVTSKVVRQVNNYNPEQ
ncbi:MAG: tetratricopeptide repeat protein [Bacteroidota bacterium]